MDNRVGIEMKVGGMQIRYDSEGMKMEVEGMDIKVYINSGQEQDHQVGSTEPVYNACLHYAHHPLALQDWKYNFSLKKKNSFKNFRQIMYSSSSSVTAIHDTSLLSQPYTHGGSLLVYIALLIGCLGDNVSCMTAINYCCCI